MTGLGVSFPSESARATTAAESRFRAPYANSRGRTASLIALDPESVDLVTQAVARAPERRREITLAATAGADWLETLRAQSQALLDDAERSDMLVMVAHAGQNVQAGTLLGEACRLRGVPVTALVMAPVDLPSDVLSHTLAQLRPFATMIVVASGLEYVEDMLLALRA